MHEVAPRAEYIQRRAAEILYDRLILRNGPVPVEALADALGVCHSTITRQCTGDIPAQIRTLVSFAGLDPEGGRLINALVQAELGFELRPVLREVASASDEEAASMLGERSGHIAMLLCRFLGDGLIDNTEAEELKQAIPKLRWALSRAEVALERRRQA